MRYHPLQQYQLAPIYAVQYALVATATCAATARGASSLHSPRGSRDDSVTGGAPAILAAEGHREFVGIATGGISQCSASKAK